MAKNAGRAGCEVSWYIYISSCQNCTKLQSPRKATDFGSYPISIDASGTVGCLFDIRNGSLWIMSSLDNYPCLLELRDNHSMDAVHMSDCISIWIWQFSLILLCNGLWDVLYDGFIHFNVYHMPRLLAAISSTFISDTPVPLDTLNEPGNLNQEVPGVRANIERGT
jgi:hypothetical protein